MITYFYFLESIYNRSCRGDKDMTDMIFALLLLVFAVVFFAYLYRVLSEEEKNEKVKCNSEDYEILNQVTTRK